MIKTINSIFDRNTFLIDLLDKVIYYFRVQNYDAALSNATIAIDNLCAWLEDVSKQTAYFNKDYEIINLDILSEILGGLLSAQENKDYVLLADLYELQILPLLYQMQEYIIANEQDEYDQEMYNINIVALEENNKELTWILKKQNKTLEDLSKEYHIEYTSCGLKTLSVDVYNKTFYLHSNKNAISEAFTLAISWYQEEKSEYIVYGLGLGYHIAELAELDNGIRIDVYESDINIIRLACAYADINSIARNPNIHIYYDPKFEKFSKRLANINDETEFVIHYPSLCTIKNLTLREKLETYFIQYSSMKNQSRLLKANFRENILNYEDTVDSLRNKWKGKDLYIVAAGPSLDKNYLKLKEAGENSVILATGTVFRKLLNAGINPDYVIVSDANPRVYAQISGLEECKIPILFLSTAHKGYAQNYQGKKYLICQKNYPEAEKFAEEHGYNLYNTGGSVSTIALDLGIQFGCKRIIFLGLDLGYTNNLVHASGTSKRELASTEGLKQVADINGKLIYTTKTLDIYRRWIEDRIKDVKDIEIIDATEGGALKKGMKIKKLSELIDK